MARRAGAGGIQRSPRWAVGVGLLLLLALFYPAVPAGAQEEDPVLYLTERPFENTLDRWNLTVFPADESDEGKQRRASQDPFPTSLAAWTWYFPRAPENWSVAAGDEWEFTLFIEGMDQLHPLPLVPPTYTVGTHGINVAIGTNEEEFANGSIEIHILDVEEGIQDYSVSVTFEEAHDFVTDDGPIHLRIDATVTGRGLEAESPLFLHYGSREHSSRVVPSKYPVDGFRAMELEFLTMQACHDMILQQESCEKIQNNTGKDGNGKENMTSPENPTEPRNDTEGTGPDAKSTPSAGVFLLIACVFLALGAIPRPLKG